MAIKVFQNQVGKTIIDDLATLLEAINKLEYSCKSYASTTKYSRVIMTWTFQIDISQEQ